MYTSFTLYSEPKRILFLDIDGVVNTLMIYSKPDRSKRMHTKDGFYFDLCHPSDKRVSNEFAVRWLNKLCIEFNLDIVITSTWLIGNSLKKVETCLRNSGLDESINIIGGISKNQMHSRGVQIEQWLKENDLNPDEHLLIILDDDSDMLGFSRDFTQYLIQCDTYLGFTFREYVKASEFLENRLNSLHKSVLYHNINEEDDIND